MAKFKILDSIFQTGATPGSGTPASQAGKESTLLDSPGS